MNKKAIRSKDGYTDPLVSLTGDHHYHSPEMMETLRDQFGTSESTEQGAREDVAFSEICVMEELPSGVQDAPEGSPPDIQDAPECLLLGVQPMNVPQILQIK